MKSKFFVWMFVAAFLISCGDDNVNVPHGSKTAPQQVTVTKVVDKAGASVIYFRTPDDSNLKYVRAEWTTDDGVTRDATASFFTDSLVIVGFKDACTVDVKLYSVSAGEAASEPVIQQVSPKRPPYLIAFDQLEITPYFMGLKTVFNQNDTRERLSFFVYREDDTEPSGWREIGQNHAARQSISFNVTGQDTIETNFAVRVRNNYGHWSDYKQERLKPWFEKRLNKRLYKEQRVHRFDETTGTMVWDDKCRDWQGHDMHSWGGHQVSFAALWDGRKMDNAAVCYHTKPTGTKLPQSFCIDLGMPYALSRLLVWMRGGSDRMGGSNDWQHVWKGGMPKTANIYGAVYSGDDPVNNLVDDIRDPNGWVLLASTVFTRADGSTDALTSGVGTEEDRLKLEAGFEVVFEDPGIPIRYVRFQTLELYNPIGSAVMLSETEYYGNDYK